MIFKLKSKVIYYSFPYHTSFTFLDYFYSLEQKRSPEESRFILAPPWATSFNERISKNKSTWPKAGLYKCLAKWVQPVSSSVCALQVNTLPQSCLVPGNCLRTIHSSKDYLLFCVKERISILSISSFQRGVGTRYGKGKKI